MTTATSPATASTAGTSTRSLLVAQLRSEASKARTVRSGAAVAAAAVGFEILFKVVSVLLLDDGTARTADVDYALKPSISFPVLLASLGVLLAAAEWRYGLAGPTFSVQPRRDVVLAAKLVLAAVAGSGVGAAATGAAGGIALVLVHARRLPSPDVPQIGAIGLGSVLAAGLLALAGVAAGTLIRNQVGALGAVTGVLLVLAPLAVLISPRIYAWTPSGAVDALSAQQAPNPDLLSQPAGAVLLVAYTLALAAAARRSLRVRDAA